MQRAAPDEGCRGPVTADHTDAFLMNANRATACRHSRKHALQWVTTGHRPASPEPAERASFSPRNEARIRVPWGDRAENSIEFRNCCRPDCNARATFPARRRARVWLGDSSLMRVPRGPVSPRSHADGKLPHGHRDDPGNSRGKMHRDRVEYPFHRGWFLQNRAQEFFRLVDDGGERTSLSNADRMIPQRDESSSRRNRSKCRDR